MVVKHDGSFVYQTPTPNKLQIVGYKCLYLCIFDYYPGAKRHTELLQAAVADAH